MSPPSGSGPPAPEPDPPPTVAVSSPSDQPAPASAEVQELPAGQVAGVGRIVATAGADAPAGRGILGTLGLRAPRPDELGRPGRGLDRVAELPTGASSACPELRPPAEWAGREFAVSVSFVVDTNGTVDRETLRVVESPGVPQSDRQYHARVYMVAASVRRDAGQVDAAAYGSEVAGEVASHAAGLVFRPALKDGQAVRSSVLISCQTLQPR